MQLPWYLLEQRCRLCDKQGYENIGGLSWLICVLYEVYN